jgi:hypothetical protein
MNIECNLKGVMWTATMGMVYERVGFMCVAVGLMLRPTRGSCGGSGRPARAQVGPADRKRSLLDDGRGGVSARKEFGELFSVRLWYVGDIPQFERLC